jgi:hypothetical protein
MTKVVADITMALGVRSPRPPGTVVMGRRLFDIIDGPPTT